jgi:hypothetical protein
MAKLTDNKANIMIARLLAGDYNLAIITVRGKSPILVEKDGATRFLCDNEIYYIETTEFHPSPSSPEEHQKQYRVCAYVDVNEIIAVNYSPTNYTIQLHEEDGTTIGSADTFDVGDYEIIRDNFNWEIFVAGSSDKADPVMSFPRSRTVQVIT